LHAAPVARARLLGASGRRGVSPAAATAASSLASTSSSSPTSAQSAVARASTAEQLKELLPQSCVLCIGPVAIAAAYHGALTPRQPLRGVVAAQEIPRGRHSQKRARLGACAAATAMPGRLAVGPRSAHGRGAWDHGGAAGATRRRASRRAPRAARRAARGGAERGEEGGRWRAAEPSRADAHRRDSPPADSRATQTQRPTTPASHYRVAPTEKKSASGTLTL
jgi:hypothetical protein